MVKCKVINVHSSSGLVLRLHCPMIVPLPSPSFQDWFNKLLFRGKTNQSTTETMLFREQNRTNKNAICMQLAFHAFFRA